MTAAAVRPSLIALMLAFARVSLSGFGGICPGGGDCWWRTSVG
ncbi:MAG: hypothetical protein ACXW3S_04500 [Rhodoplanes sp.]